MPRFKFFCYICKQHFSYPGKTEKEAQQEFRICGHNKGVDRAPRQLRKGLIGVHPKANQV